MRTLRFVSVVVMAALLALPVARAAGAEAPPELRGMLVVGESRDFSLTTAGGVASGWIKVGGSFEGWKLVEYRADEEALVVRKGEIEEVLKLAGAKIKPAVVKATLAEADELMGRMQFEEMLTKTLEQQKKAMEPMLKQLIPDRPGQDRDALVALQLRIMDEMWKGLEPEQLRKDVAAIYADVFTSDEIRGMADFYGTGAGRAMIEKQPELQQRTMAVMMPRIMAAMPRVQKIAAEFAAEQQAKAKESPAAAP